MTSGLFETTYPPFPGSNTINSYVYFAELSVLSLVIHNLPCAVFKAISKSSKLQAIPREVTPYLQPIRVLFNRAIHL